MPMLTTLLATLAAAPQTTPDPEEASVRHPITVVDEGTGAPIEGATVHRVAEAEFPTWGPFDLPPGKVTDAQGQVSFEGKARGWYIVMAEGYGVRGDMYPGPDQPLGMTPEVPITVEVVDFTGRPMPLTHLGVCVGCGHTPDVICATTGPDGRAAIRGASPNEGIVDLYPVHPDLIRDEYSSVPFDQMNAEGVARLRVGPGTVLHGRVLFPDGTPAAGFAVGSSVRHRGPWTLTDAEGRFSLYGLKTQPDWLEVRGPEGRLTQGFGPSRAGVHRTLVLEDPDLESGEAGSVDGQPVTVVVTATVPAAEGSSDRVPAAGVPVEAWDPSTGWCDRAVTKEDGTATLTVPPGTELRLEAGGPHSPFPVRDLGVLRAEEGGAPVGKHVEMPKPRVATLTIRGVKRGDDIVLTRADGSALRLAEDGIEALAADAEAAAVQAVEITLPTGRWGITRSRVDERLGYSTIDFPLAIRDTGTTVEIDFGPRSNAGGSPPGAPR